MTLFIVTVTVSLSISLLCSLMEACLLSLSLADIAAINEKRPVIAETWKKFRANIQKPIAVILIVNTLAHTMGASISGSLYNELFTQKWIVLYSIIYSLVMIQFTEILPKTLGVKYNRTVAVLTGTPFKYIVSLFMPVLFVVQWINRPFEGKKGTETAPDAISDIEVLARFAAMNKQITQEQEKIVSGGISLSQTKVEDIMENASDIKFLSTDMSLHDALIEAHIHHHTRFPLIDGKDLHKVLGYVNFKDIVSALQVNPEDPTLKGICRPMMEVSPSDNVTALLSRLTKSYQHIAIVRDAGGKTAGLVTLEDVVEAIVGDIHDEYDVLPSHIYKITHTRYLVGGGVTLLALREKTGEDLPMVKLSLNDWMIQQLRRNPKVEDKLGHGGSCYIVRKVRRSQIYEVILEKGAGCAESPLPSADSASGI